MANLKEWETEVNECEWNDLATARACKIKRNGSGALCGYVGVKKDHPAFELHYDDPKLYYIDVHGGLTFSGTWKEKDIWFLGFDCAHSGDLEPELDRKIYNPNSTYRNLAYVTREVSNLAMQLHVMEPAKHCPTCKQEISN